MVPSLPVLKAPAIPRAGLLLTARVRLERGLQGNGLDDGPQAEELQRDAKDDVALREVGREIGLGLRATAGVRPARDREDVMDVVVTLVANDANRAVRQG